MYDPGTTTFMIMSCALVLMMGPALALFYGGLSRRKNVVNTMLMCVMAMGAVGCLWAVLGDSIAYGGPDAFDEDGSLVNVAALFAGGTAVHICSGLGGLVLALILGKRMGFEIHVVRPHNVPAVMLGCGLLFVGWFGFNGGSALAAVGYAALAICNTLLAGCAASASWLVVERIVTGKPTLVGGCTGILAGLVVITPACGFVDPMIAIVMGIIVSPICYFFIAVLKRKLGWDDALDAFGCHGVGGIVGCILTGIFALPELSFNGLGGLLYTGDPTLLINQCLSVLATVVYMGITTAIIGFVAKALFGGSLRVGKDEETRGLDTTVHGESGYPSFTGLDQ